jgi:hypothetical protein
MGVKARISQELVLDVEQLDDEKLQHWITVLRGDVQEIEDKIYLEHQNYAGSGVINRSWLNKAEMALKAKRTAAMSLETERKRRNRAKTEKLYQERMDKATSPYFQFVGMVKKRMEYAEFLKLWTEACDRAEAEGKAKNGKAA